MSSFLNRISSWFAGMKQMGLENEINNGVFQNFPMELYDKFFCNLNISDMKSCRLVCFTWNTLLTRTARRLFKKRARATFRGSELDHWEYAKSQLQLVFQRQVVFGNHLRIIDIWKGRVTILETWIYLIKKNNIKSLEFINCILHISTMTRILSEFNNLTELNLHEVYFHVPLQDVENSQCKGLVNLKKLHFCVKNSWAVNHLPNFMIILSSICTNLETFCLELFDTGHRQIDHGWGIYQKFFGATCLFLSRNAKTLKELFLNTYDVEDGRRYHHIIIQNSELPREHSYFLFDMFLSEIEGSNLNEMEFPNLCKLSLRFRVAALDRTVLFQSAFLPFLSKMKNLKNFEISQIYAIGEEEVTNILRTVPWNCYCRLEKLFTLRPAISLIANRQILRNELQLLANIVRRHNVYLTIPPNPILNQDFTQSVVGYNDSSIELETDRVHWTILFATPKSMIEVQPFISNANFLTKIQIQQQGVIRSHKIKLDDADMQYICKNVPYLMYLKLEFCNLNDITDFGLTGISPEACQRMNNTKDYQIQVGDLVGNAVSFSNLKYLRCLILSDLETGITNITAYNAFNDLKCLIKLRISGHGMSEEGVNVLSNLIYSKSKTISPFLYK